MPPKLAQRIAEKSSRNLRRAILLAEGCKVQQPLMSGQQDVPELDWEVFLRETATLIVQEQTPRRLLEVANYFLSPTTAHKMY